jgi:hypothetical protein
MSKIAKAMGARRYTQWNGKFLKKRIWRYKNANLSYIDFVSDAD